MPKDNKDEIERLHKLLRDSLKAIEIAMDFEEDVFGIHHNDVMDTVLKIEFVLKEKGNA